MKKPTLYSCWDGVTHVGTTSLCFLYEYIDTVAKRLGRDCPCTFDV